MLYLLIKAALSGAIVAATSEVAKRFPGFGGFGCVSAHDPLVVLAGRPCANDCAQTEGERLIHPGVKQSSCHNNVPLFGRPAWLTVRLSNSKHGDNRRREMEATRATSEA
jgi:hypothetical protein